MCLSVEFSDKVVVPYFTWQDESWSLVPTLGGPSKEFPGYTDTEFFLSRG